MLLFIYTSCRLAEIVDIQKEKSQSKAKRTAKGENACRYQKDDSNNQDSGYNNIDKPRGNSLEFGNLDYQINLNDTNYDNINVSSYTNLKQEYKALYYEDICIQIVQNPSSRRYNFFVIEITFAYYKSADRKPKLYVFNLSYSSLIFASCFTNSNTYRTTFFFYEEELLILYSISYILAIAIRDDAIKVDRYNHAELFFTTSLQALIRAILVHQKLKKLKTPMF